MIYIGIVGSRERSEKEEIEKIIVDAMKKYGAITLVSGGADGIDKEAEAEAKFKRVSRIIYEPIFSEYKIKGTDIYFERNKKIAKISNELHAFPLDRMGGTMNTIKHFKQAGKTDRLFIYD